MSKSAVFIYWIDQERHEIDLSSCDTASEIQVKVQSYIDEHAPIHGAITIAISEDD